MRGQRGELVGGAPERHTAAARQLRRDARAELGMGVQPGADRGTADRQFVERRERSEQ